MTVEQLRAFVDRRPFEPFTIHLNDGSRLKISEPDDLVLPRRWRWNAIVLLDHDRFTILYVRNIAHVSSHGRWPRARGGRRGQGASDDE